MTEIKLYHKKATYTAQDGKERNVTNFYLQLGNQRIPIEVKYFPNKETQRDDQYASRKLVMLAFSEELPVVAEK